MMNVEQRTGLIPPAKSMSAKSLMTALMEATMARHFWMNLLSQANEFRDSHWGIVKIDMAGIPTTARVYQDIQSRSGIIIDRLDGIPADFITEVRIETDPSVPL